VIAARFKVQHVKTLCEEIVIRNIDDFDALEAFKLGHTHDSKKMVDIAFNEIKLMYPDIRLEEKLKNNLDRVIKIVEAKQLFDNTVEELNS